MSPHRYQIYSWKEFHPDDFATLDLMEDEKDLAIQHADFLETLADMNARQTCGVAFIDECEGGEIVKRTPLYIGGFYETSPGVAQVFLILDKRSLNYPKTLLHSVRRWREYIEGFEWCHRLQTFSLPTKLIDRWMLATGFVYEGTLRRYTDTGRDYKLWSRVKLNGVWGSPTTRE